MDCCYNQDGGQMWSLNNAAIARGGHEPRMSLLRAMVHWLSLENQSANWSHCKAKETDTRTVGVILIGIKQNNKTTINEQFLKLCFTWICAILVIDIWKILHLFSLSIKMLQLFCVFFSPISLLPIFSSLSFFFSPVSLSHTCSPLSDLFSFLFFLVLSLHILLFILPSLKPSIA